jgi:hypothetical protein
MCVHLSPSRPQSGSNADVADPTDVSNVDASASEPPPVDGGQPNSRPAQSPRSTDAASGARSCSRRGQPRSPPRRRSTPQPGARSGAASIRRHPSRELAGERPDRHRSNGNQSRRARLGSQSRPAPSQRRRRRTPSRHRTARPRRRRGRPSAAGLRTSSSSPPARGWARGAGDRESDWGVCPLPAASALTDRRLWRAPIGRGVGRSSAGRSGIPLRAPDGVSIPDRSISDVCRDVPMWASGFHRPVPTC